MLHIRCAPVISLGVYLLTGCVGELGGSGSATSHTETNPAPQTPFEESGVYARLTKQEYRYVVTDLLRGADRADRDYVLEAVDAFEEGTYRGYYKNYGSIVTSPGLDRAIVELSRRLADAFMDSSLYAELCTEECAASLIERIVPRLWKRPLSPDEIGDLHELYGALPAEHRDAVFSFRIFASPFFHYKVWPHASDDPVAESITRAARLSFAVAGSYPDDMLFEAAQRGELRSPSDWRPHVERLVRPYASRFSTLFITQWLGLGSLAESDGSWRSGRFESLMAEPAEVFGELLQDDRSLSSLLVLDFNMVDDDLATVYGLAPLTGPGRWERRRVTETLFGTAALSYRSQNHESEQPSPILRGSYVVNRLLCRNIQFPPSAVQAEIDTVLMNAPADASPPEQLAYFRSQPACGSCHALFDPYGLALEEIGLLGEAREIYETGDPVASAGTAGEIDYSSSLDFVEQLATSEEFARCFASQVNSYVSGAPYAAVFAELGESGERFDGQDAVQLVTEMVTQGLEEETP